MLPAVRTVVDRVAPTRRPAERQTMWQRWSRLLFLHWRVPPESLRPLLPPGLTLDTFEGDAYVGLVPFTMSDVRPVGSPALGLLSRFHETNVRTYVHFYGREPGVWFFSLDAASAAAVRIARAWYRLPYHFARMSMEVQEPPTGSSGSDVVSYRTERLWPGPIPATCAVRFGPAGPVAAADVGSLEHFLVERYILYAYSGGKLFRGRVNHSPYPLQPAVVYSLSENLVAAAGISRPDETPLAHYSGGVHVRVYSLREVEKMGEK